MVEYLQSVIKTLELGLFKYTQLLRGVKLLQFAVKVQISPSYDTPHSDDYLLDSSYPTALCFCFCFDSLLVIFHYSGTPKRIFFLSCFEKCSKHSIIILAHLVVVI